MDFLLQRWGLSDINDIFKANNIHSEHDLSDLLHESNSSDLNLLIPNVLSRIKLRRCFNEYILNKTTNFASEDISNVINESITEPILFDVTNIVNEDKNVIVIEDVSANNNILESSIANENTQPYEEKRYKEKSTLSIKTELFDLKEILSKTAYGNSLLLINQHGGQITTQCQSILCDIITSYFLNLNIRTLQNEDFDKIAKEIVKLFPNECEETYYMPPVRKRNSRNDKAGISRGKLVDKYRNALKFIRSAEKLNNKYQTEQTITSESEGDKIVEENRKWLIHNHRPQSEVDKKWDASYILRVQDCANKIYKNVNDILIKWPVLKLESGFLLIERDFDRKFSEHKERLITSWDAEFEKFYNFFKKNLSTADYLHEILMNAQSLSNDSKTAIQIWLLASVVAPKSNKICIKIGNKKRLWRPTISECREGILVHCKLPGDVGSTCKEKENKMLQMNLSMQPFIIVVGPQITSIEKIYVRLDKTLYPMPSVLKALDILFKVFITFNAYYPKECENVWYLIQWGIYDIHTSWDENIPFLCCALSKMKRGLCV